jgi:hypothetical protein
MGHKLNTYVTNNKFQNRTREKTTGIIKQNNPKPLRSMSSTIGFTPIKINQFRRLS